MTPTQKLLTDFLTLAEKGTKVVSWYAHNTEVRCPFCRWFTVSDVNPEYEKHVGTKADDCRFAAESMNLAPAMAKALLVAVEALEYAEGQLMHAGYTANAAPSVRAALTEIETILKGAPANEK